MRTKTIIFSGVVFCLIAGGFFWYQKAGLAGKQSLAVIAPAAKPVILEPRGWNSFFNSKNTNVTAAKPPKPIAATVTVNGKSSNAMPNSIGLYPRIYVDAGSAVHVQLSVDSGEQVGIQVLDGGMLEGKAAGNNLQGNADGHVKFDYLARKEPGSYRIAIYARGIQQFFDFWVGPEPKLALAKATFQHGLNH